MKLDIFNVNLSDCYKKIIQEYNITENLIYAQIDFLDNSNSINYLLYDPKTNKILNMSEFENMDISISKNIKLNEEIKTIINNANEQGYNIANINDRFYNDVCTPYTTNNGTDITITDRITDIYDKNFKEFINYNDCKIENFNVSESNAKVTCKTKVKTNFFEEIKSLDISQLLYNFQFCEASNFYVVTCYKEFFSKKGQSYNYGDYIYYFIFAVVFILFGIYFCTGINYLKIKFEKIKDCKKFIRTKKRKSTSKLVKVENNKKLDCISNSNNIDFPNSNNQFPASKELYFNIENKSNPIKKRYKDKKKIIKSSSNENKNRSADSQNILVKKNKSKIKNIESKIKKKNKDNLSNNMILIKEKNKNEKEIRKEKTAKQEMENKSIDKKIKKKLKKNTFKDLNEVDLNELDYKEAIEYDKRTFLQLYLSFIRLKHPILYLFYDDYNIYTVKCILFVHSFASHICMNALFFREDTMHRVYKNNGTFDFIYRLPFTLYSVIISGVISFALKKLILTKYCIIEYKKVVGGLKNKDEAVKKAAVIIKYFKTKFLIFIALVLLTLVAFWFYIGCFCTIYHNTQFHLIKDSLIGFGLSMIYPFGILLIGILVRVIALKKKYELLYRISRLIA